MSDPLELDPGALFTQHRLVVAADTDPYGIVDTPRIPDFVVAGVKDWFAERLSIDLSTGGPHMVFASLSCTFLSPMRPGDTLEMRIALRRVGRSSLGFEIVGYRQADSRLCWMAETVCVFIDSGNFRSRPVPDALRPALRTEAELAVRHPFAE